MDKDEQKKVNPTLWQPNDFWLNYVGNMNPSAFLKISGVYSPFRAVEKHLKKLSTFYGIVRRNTWKETFSQSLQFTFEEVYYGIIAYLTETEDEWKQEWKEFWLAPDSTEPLIDSSDTKAPEN
ncbi:MAG TPA: hypothetical protein PLX23_09205 [Candidatus Hydrogenedens sp.]|nr:hypothetical protein [Candidatus Hydrogenedens sp.]